MILSVTRAICMGEYGSVESSKMLKADGPCFGVAAHPLRGSRVCLQSSSRKMQMHRQKVAQRPRAVVKSRFSFSPWCVVYSTFSGYFSRTVSASGISFINPGISHESSRQSSTACLKLGLNPLVKVGKVRRNDWLFP